MSTPAFQLRVPASPVHDSLAALHVLVVEDDTLQCDLVCAALRHFGVHDIRAVGDAQAAMADLDTGHCDLLICDLNLPGMDGLEFLHRAASRDVDAFVIMSAADASILATVEETLVERGALVPGILPKPLTMQAVRRVLRRLGEARNHGRPDVKPAPAPLADAATLAQALQARQFIPFYQPKVDPGSGRLLGLEILARWRRPGGEIVAPAAFISTMEQSELIDRLSWQLIEQALVDAAAWRACSPLAFNFTPRTLEQPGLPERLSALARRHGYAPEQITLELTETAMASSPQAVRDCVTRLRLRGFGIAIDDFGIGYSSLALLLGLPFTELKIDRSFVAHLASSAKARTLLETMIALGARLGMGVIAEGVENEADLRLLRALGCPGVQGFHIARPMSRDDLLDWLVGRGKTAGVQCSDTERSGRNALPHNL
jgi:EAL domain-containing protein (putative c-di-GMP-specific phosphodiesterase class I)/DNA-binding NarL/FixJ family response regulator